ncbi:FKBP-type peptidyl-prolyl cis-trans isomerase [Maricaulis sp.]|uniref:FKBP-type peptidyl-prolyl cis-trans isomerase n=1 Tax=Maricaulis sp. TaxID=1486257 RepID=UPI00262BDAB9|nr:FKBP-type peptidyl-prolyl cis-trans isomerase [Maricaulis sp.]
MQRSILATAASVLALSACSAPPPANDEEALARARACDTPESAEIPLADAPEEAGDAEANAAAAEAYLETVRTGRCVFELENGLVFRIRDAVEDGPSPERGDLVTVHYRGLFPHGDEFDSSYARGEPATFPSDRLIRGWVEALPLMRVGETWELYIPPALGYGERGTGPIGPNQALVFQLELIDLPGHEDEDSDGDG